MRRRWGLESGERAGGAQGGAAEGDGGGWSALWWSTASREWFVLIQEFDLQSGPPHREVDSLKSCYGGRKRY